MPLTTSPTHPERPESIPWTEIAAYVTGEADAPTRQMVEQWAAAHVVHHAWLERVRVAWQGDVAQVDAWQPDVEAMQRAVHAQIAQTQTESLARWGHSVAVARQRPAPRLGRWARSVAGALGVAACGVIAYRVFVPSAAPSIAKTYTTAIGQQTTVTLANGVRVTLAPQTVLRVSGWEAVLVGEAFFTVARHEARPFTVRTGRTVTRVLGTAFDVRRYGHERETRVIVIDGKVVTGVTRLVTLSARMMAHVTDSTVTTVPIDDPSVPTGWTSGRLVFEDTPAGEVLDAVSRWYGVAFRLRDPALASRVMSTVLDVRHSRSETLAVLASVLEVRMTATGDTITLTPNAERATHLTPMSRTEIPHTFSPDLERGR